MRKVLRRALALLALVVALQLLIGVTSVLADPGYHVVSAGETLFSIGRLYGVSPWTIAQLNGLANPNYLWIGQVLYIPSGWSAPAPAPAPSWGYQPSQWYQPQGYPGYYYHPVNWWPWNWQYPYGQWGQWGWQYPYGQWGQWSWQQPYGQYSGFWNWYGWDP